MNKGFSKNITDLETLKWKLIQFGKSHSHFYFLNSNQINSAMDLSKYELLVGIGCIHEFNTSFSEFNSEIEKNKHWYFTTFKYESFKNFDFKIDDEESINFIQPEIVITIPFNENNVVQWFNNGIQEQKFIQYKMDFDEFNENAFEYKTEGIEFQASMTKDEYLDKVTTIKNQIIEGDYYELNLCQKFNAKVSMFSPDKVYWHLNKQSPSPFSAFVKIKHDYIISMSPERFLTKKGQELTSQPIKGTNLKSEENNEIQKNALKNSEKDRAENVMIVDLVRNDLGRISEAGSIQVKELFGIYSHQYVNHMVSTISSTMKKNIGFSEIMKSLFPMGSMTGAPKIEVMKNIEQHENNARGYYSGSIGYVDNQGDFDFNVVIRSLIYNELSKDLSYQVGGAITYDSDAELEYEECKLKGLAFRNL